MLFSYFFFLSFFLIDEILNFLLVGAAVKQQAVGTQPVAARPTDLLVIRFYILGHIEVYHKTDIRLVNTHAKGNSSYNNGNIVPNKKLLVPGAHFFGKSRVVRFHRMPFFFQLYVQLLNLPAREAVDNARLLFPGIEEVKGLLNRIVLVGHLEK